MGLTPDRTPGKSLEEGTVYEDVGNEAGIEVGEVRRVGDDLRFQQSGGSVSLVSGTGISAGAHKTLDQLVHLIAETSYEEVTRTGTKVDSVIVWTSAAKTQKIREELFTYTGNQVTQIVTKQYDGSGVLVETLTEALSYTGTQLDSITRTLT